MIKSLNTLFLAGLAVKHLKYMVCKLQLHTIKESGIFLRSKTINFRLPLTRYVPTARLPRIQDNYFVTSFSKLSTCSMANFLNPAKTLFSFSPTSMPSCLGNSFDLTH